MSAKWLRITALAFLVVPAIALFANWKVPSRNSPRPRNGGPGSPAARQDSAVATISDFDLSLAFGAKKLDAWRPPVAPEAMQPSLRQFARQLLDEAVKDLGSETNPEWKATTLGEAADNYLLIDPQAAKATLEKAWASTKQIKSNAGITQTGLVKIWCGLDVDHAKALIPKISDQYWIDFSKTEFGQYVARYDPEKGAAILTKEEAMDRDRDVTNFAYEVMYNDPSAAVRFIRLVPTINQDSTIGAVIFNLSDNSLNAAEPLLAEIKSPKERDRALQQMVDQAADEFPERAAATALSLKDPASRALACSHMVRIYARTSLPKARFMAAQALAALDATQGEDKKYLPDGMIPDIAFVDTPGVRALLSSLEKEAVDQDKKWGDQGTGFGTIPSSILPLAGAWAEIDPAKADQLVEQEMKVKPGGRVDRTDIGSFMNKGYQAYLISVARHDPQHAAELLKPLVPEGQTGFGSETHIAPLEIAKELLKHDPEQATLFAKALGDKMLIKSVQDEIAISQIKDHPESAFEVIPKLKAYFGILEMADQSSVGSDAAIAFVKRDDVKSAERVATLMALPGDKAKVYGTIAWSLLRHHPEQVAPVLELAKSSAMAETRPGIRASSLVALAGDILQMAGCSHWK